MDGALGSGVAAVLSAAVMVPIPGSLSQESQKL
jgi:hypothetical protein